MKGDRFFSVILFAAGLMAVVTALLAHTLGIDQGAGWGRARMMVLLAGGLLIAFALVLFFYAARIFYGIDRARYCFQTVCDFSRYRLVPVFVAVVVLFYIWLASSGTWTTWTSPTRYYANLAKGFQKGNLYSISTPPKDLLSLSNPYDPLARAQAGIKPPIDISYYKGRFYLYWGPVPAMLLVAVSPFYGGRVGDLQLVFAFICGIFILQTILVTMIWDIFFQHLPQWALFLSILVIGLSSPVTFMLDNASSARIYEAAITGAQFFLIGGVMVAIMCIRGRSDPWKLVLAASLWSLALGTRQSTALSIGFMVCVLIYKIIQENKTFFQKIGLLLALISPLLLGLAGLLWYNWARFDSFTETGLSYQMNGGRIYKHPDTIMGTQYVLQNLYNYLAMPYRYDTQFPFLHPELGNRAEILFSSSRSLYGAQIITGIFYTVPFTVFSIIPFYALLFKKKPIHVAEQFVFNWTVITLGGSALAAFGFLAIFFWAAMRYAEDFMPSLILLSAIGFWQGYSLLLEKPLMRKVYAVAGIVLATVSITVSTLLAVSVNDARFVLIRLFSVLY